MPGSIFQSIKKMSGIIPPRRHKNSPNSFSGKQFRINLAGEYGFPTKPLCLSYDAILDLLAVTTTEGSVYVYGRPGVCFQYNIKSQSAIVYLEFIHGSSRMIAINNSCEIYLLGIVREFITENSYIQEINELKDYSLQVKNLLRDCTLNPNGITLSNDSKYLFLGITPEVILKIGLDNLLDHNNLEIINLSPFIEELPQSIYLRIKNCPIIVLMNRPGFPDHILIGYSCGICIISDLKSGHSNIVLQNTQDLESACWCGGSGFPTIPVKTPPEIGTRLLTTYSDGTIATWNLNGIISTSGKAYVLARMEEAPTMPYGPFPCLSISHVLWLYSDAGGITVFAGGLPKHPFNTHTTITILRGSNIDRAAKARIDHANQLAIESAEGEDSLTIFGNINNPSCLPPVHVFDSDAPERVCLDLSSKLVDICAVGPSHGPFKSLFILCEEELIAIDLLSPEWPVLELPYLNCLHTSNITTYGLNCLGSNEFMDRLRDSWVSMPNCLKPACFLFSDSSWPIQGGSIKTQASDRVSNDVLLLGHENGSVVFWKLNSSGCLECVYRLFTSQIFDGEFSVHQFNEQSESWPPFRPTGQFDPFIDDIRIAVTAIKLIGSTLLVGGAAGQVTIWRLQNHFNDVCYQQLLIKRENHEGKWRGSRELSLRDFETLTNIHSYSGLHAIGVVQVIPPSSITCLAGSEISNPISRSYEFNSILIAIGTPNGFGMVNLSLKKKTCRSYEIPDVSMCSQIDIILRYCTIPKNLDASSEVSTGDGWARRRTRDLKKSLRDSFRRLKRMRSSIYNKSLDTTFSNAPANGFKFATHRGAAIQPTCSRASSSLANEAIAFSDNAKSDHGNYFPLTGVEREITDRPTNTIDTALVRNCLFSPINFPVVRRSHVSLTVNETICVGAAFFGTAGGIVYSFSIYEDSNANITCELSKEMVLQHKAPILSMKIIEPRSRIPFPDSTLNVNTSCLSNDSRMLIKQCSIHQMLFVITEEQLRVYNLPNFTLKHKLRVTAKDGSKIINGSVVMTNSHATPSKIYSNSGIIFFNNLGLVSLIDIPTLKVRDQIQFINSIDRILIGSIALAESSICLNTNTLIESNELFPYLAPSLGIYQLSSGQFNLFDVSSQKQDSSFLGDAYKSLGFIENPQFSHQHNYQITERNENEHASKISTENTSFVDQNKSQNCSLNQIEKSTHQSPNLNITDEKEINLSRIRLTRGYTNSKTDRILEKNQFFEWT